MIFGKSLDVVNQGHASSAGYLAALWKGEVNQIHHAIAPRKSTIYLIKSNRKLINLEEYFIDVQDCALLHVASIILPDVKGQRIFGFAGHFSWDAVLDILRRHEPERKFPDNFSGGEDLNEIKLRAQAEQMLRRAGMDIFRGYCFDEY